MNLILKFKWKRIKYYHASMWHSGFENENFQSNDTIVYYSSDTDFSWRELLYETTFISKLIN